MESGSKMSLYPQPSHLPSDPLRQGESSLSKGGPSALQGKPSVAGKREFLPNFLVSQEQDSTGATGPGALPLVKTDIIRLPNSKTLSWGLTLTLSRLIVIPMLIKAGSPLGVGAGPVPALDFWPRQDVGFSPRRREWAPGRPRWVAPTLTSPRGLFPTIRRGSV